MSRQKTSRTVSYNKKAPIGLYIPPILRSLTIKPDACTLTSVYDPVKNVTHFTYRLEWEEEEKNAPVEQEKEIDNTAPVKESSSKQESEFQHPNVDATSTVKHAGGAVNRAETPALTSDVARESKELQGSEFSKLRLDSAESKSSSSDFSLSNIERYIVEQVMQLSCHEKSGLSCDGPCRKRLASHNLHQLDRCGHYLCELCASMGKNADGSDGCSAFSCFLANCHFLPDEHAKQSYIYLMISKRQQMDEDHRCAIGNSLSEEERQKSSGNRAPANGAKIFSLESVDKNYIVPTSKNEMICVRVTVLEPEFNVSIRRMRFDLEVPATETLLTALNSCIPKGILEDPSKKWLNDRLLFVVSTRVGAQLIPKEDLDKYMIYELPAANSVLNFILDYTNTVNIQ